MNAGLKSILCALIYPVYSRHSVITMSNIVLYDKVDLIVFTLLSFSFSYVVFSKNNSCLKC